MSTAGAACACIGPHPGHRYCPCMERQGFREPIRVIETAPPGFTFMANWCQSCQSAIAAGRAVVCSCYKPSVVINSNVQVNIIGGTAS